MRGARHPYKLVVSGEHCLPFIEGGKVGKDEKKAAWRKIKIVALSSKKCYSGAQPNKNQH